MKIHLLSVLVCLSSLMAAPCFAENNLILNGSFDSWDQNLPTDWMTNDPTNLGKFASGSEGNAVLVMANADLRQMVAGTPKSFTIKFKFTVNQSPDNGGFSQSLVLSIYQTSELMASGDAWISIRLQSNKASAFPFSLAAFDGNDWQSLTDATFTPSVLADDNKAFTSASVYEMAISYDAGSDKYSIEYGPEGGKTKEIKSLSYYRHPSKKDGLIGLQFYSNDNGFTLDDVTVTKDR